MVSALTSSAGRLFQRRMTPFNTVGAGFMFLKGSFKRIDEKKKVIALSNHFIVYFDVFVISLCIICFFGV